MCKSFQKKANDEKDAKEDEQQDEEDVKQFVDGVLNTEEDSDIPDNKYFKGFWAFALWGYIPPPGYEEYKCTLITTVIDEGKKSNDKKMEELNQRPRNQREGW